MNTYPCLTVAFALAAAVANAAPALVTRPATNSITASSGSFLPQFSREGSFLVYVSASRNLVSNDGNDNYLNVYSYNYLTRATTLVSASTNVIGGADDDANFACVSSNGQFVVFASRAGNLVPGDTNNAQDIFMRDVLKNRTFLVSESLNGGSPNESNTPYVADLSGNPLLSHDAKYIYFESRSTNLITLPDGNRAVDIFRRTMWTNVVVPVSVNFDGTAMAGGKSTLQAISLEGRYVLFSSTATNIAPGISTNALYLRDMAGSNIVWASTNYPGFESATLSVLGDVVAFIAPEFDSYGYNLGFGSVVRVDWAAGLVETIGTATNLAAGLQMSEDGKAIAFTEAGTQQVAIWRQGSGITRPAYGHAAGISRDGTWVLVAPRETRVAGAQDPTVEVLGYLDSYVLLRTNSVFEYIYNGASTEFGDVCMRRDGFYTAFASAAPDVVGGDLNQASDVFSKMRGRATLLISGANFVRQSSSAFSSAWTTSFGISADGRYVVAVRDDEPSFLDDTNGVNDIYLNDTLTGTSQPLSLSLITNEWNGGAPPSIGNISQGCLAPKISADGSTIVAQSRVAGNELNRFDLVITRGTNGVFPAGMVLARSSERAGFESYTSPSLSADGRLVAFTMTRQNGSSDVFARHYEEVSATNMPTTYLISRGTNGFSGNGPSWNSAISVDGRIVTFHSRASSMVHPVTVRSNALYPPLMTWTYNASQLLAADVGTDRTHSNFLNQFTTRLCSYTIVTNSPASSYPDPAMTFTTLKPLDADVETSALSGDARYVLFGLTNRAAVYRHDLHGVRTNWFYELQEINGTTSTRLAHGLEPGAANLLVCTNCANPATSDDGSVVAFERIRAGTSLTDVYVADLNNGTELLVSRSPDGQPGNGSSRNPQVSGNGRFVVFESAASNLAVGDGNLFTDVFVRDRLLSHTYLVSADASGVSGNGPSANAVMGADGQTIVFQTTATLSPNDFNSRRDLMLVRMGGTDEDQDGMDDDWEVAYFGHLDRNGDGDFDDDGHTDLNEFRAGTEPTDSGSVFRVLKVEFSGGTNRRLLWAGTPTATYRVEYKDDLNALVWHTLNTEITWSGQTGSATDPEPATGRFYRVLRIAH